MRVSLYDGIGSIDLINQSEPDWRYTPLCDDPQMVAREALADDPTPNAARIRALLANSFLASRTPTTAGDSLTRSLEGALRGGSIRLTGWHSAAPEPLAPYTPPAKPAKVQRVPARVGKQAASQAEPEEATAAEAECLGAASRQGAAFIA